VQSKIQTYLIQRSKEFKETIQPLLRDLMNSFGFAIQNYSELL